MDAIENLKELFRKFPGIGPKQAERFVYFLLHSSPTFKKTLSEAIAELETHTKRCESCNRFFLKNSGERDALCKICSDKSRNLERLMVLEKETDIDKIENSGASYDGLYFVSFGTLSPLQDAKRHKTFIKHIKDKIKRQSAQELILAFSTTFEGEYTANYIKDSLKDDMDFNKLKISILGRGLSSGSEIEYADPETLRYALKNRLNL